MIGKQEILARAREWGLRPEVVEKDYVLGWTLAAIAEDEEASVNWILKGGTCVKKCFIETYRFSEDLDFSLREKAPYDESAIVAALSRIADRVGDMSGVVMPHDQIIVRSRRDVLGRPTFEGRIGYHGPLQMPGWPRILFDITRHEPIIEAPAQRGVIHPYSDAPAEQVVVLTYAFEELLAEKARALHERTRPRDLYDVVYIIPNVQGIDAEKMRQLFAAKCRAKQVVPPTRAELTKQIHGSAELRAEWNSMLAHQLQELPPIDGVLQRLDEALAWMEPRIGRVSEVRTALPARMEGAVFTGRAVGAGADVMERLRFAGANRLLVEFSYHGKPRRVEPYSLRVAGTGNLLLYAHEMSSGIVKAFKVAEVDNLRVTRDSFVPRFEIELGLTPSASIPRSVHRTRSARQPARSRSSRRFGPVYTFQCPVCGKRFKRKKHDSRLRMHTYPDSHVQCGARNGVFVGME
ncbi:MAG: nucleotidyl transferase AbiEii/AbiGii toxin family protein [Gemmatimonadaceae bacterium]